MHTPPEALPRWKTALRLLRAIAALPEADPGRAGRIGEARAFFEGSGVDRLRQLARLLEPGLTDRQLLCAIVPVERVAARERVADADMGLVSRDRADAPATRLPLVVVADNIRSAVNTGGLFRTAEFFGAEALWLCGYSATPDHPHVARAAMGAERLVPWRAFDRVQDALDALRAEGRRIYALETAERAEDVADCAWAFPAALLLGNERFGLDPETLAQADAVVAIAGHGVKNSLNVVSAFSIAIHHMRRRHDSP
ncbi:MAG: TrmH family RNA methyltransferase [Kiritimatiellae bacterium]|jgi:tRNA G18 (ribose-2'-O)-methylase SpoU|nr:TrmH family RNA methyltransferase [Kiritimatiellia bacterium]